ncbi:uncharacterized protein LOC144447706 [Glandiceps talaboti]
MPKFPLTAAIFLILTTYIFSMNEAACRSRWKVFSLAACKRSEDPSIKDYMTEFRLFDLNDDSVITFDEVDRLEAFLKEMDNNGDNKVSLTEYIYDAEKSDRDTLNV